MKNTLIAKQFERIVKNKFNIYNSLFLNLPYPKVTNIGILIPILYQTCKSGLQTGNDPSQILEHFFNSHTGIDSEEEKIDFMFRVIQYVERQVVLYDSVEDAAFTDLIKVQNDLTLQDYISVADNEKESDKFLQKISSFSTRIVFTAHPTQFYTPPVLDIISRLRSLITKNDINQIDLTLQQLGLTSLINLKKPSPLDEAKNVIYFMKTVYYDALGEMYARIKSSIPDKNFDNPDLIQFGFWPGGDRDGNPFVTANITEKVSDNLRMTLMSCYLKDVKNIQKKLTFRKVEEPLNNLTAALYESSFDSIKILKYEEIIEPLLSIKNSLINDYNSLYIDELDNLIDKVKIFRTHFAVLDIRQHHNIHKRTIEEIFRINGLIKKELSELNEEELLQILINEDLDIEENELVDELVIDTVRNIKNLRSIQEKNGEKGCSRYIISNTEDAYSVLFVFSLLRWCCWGSSQIPFDIIPLFESIESMENSTEIMDKLFKIPVYRKHVADRNNIQTIMLGFSDGTKDGGYFQANWSIFKTKENLTDICKKHDIKPIFFDGRGGPPARGGGKTHRFYASQSDRIANHALQITIQGQTITSKFGTKEHFIHNSEQLLTAGLSHSLFATKNIISEEYRNILEELAKISYEKYSLLKNHKMFIPYLENKSTLKYYGETKIGSRPTKRGNDKELNLNDLRAIPFVGSWSQLKQNVPGYFGLGTALKSLSDDGKLNELKRIFRDVPFFKALILNSMMSLSKCNFGLTEYISKDLEYSEFWNILYEEYNLTKEMVLMISEYDQLMQEEPISKSSIEIRESIVLPLLVIQQAALQKIQSGSDSSENYKKIVRRSLYGNINASRNSA